jgi:hypothetical protein
VKIYDDISVEFDAWVENVCPQGLAELIQEDPNLVYQETNGVPRELNQLIPFWEKNPNTILSQLMLDYTDIGEESSYHVFSDLHTKYFMEIRDDSYKLSHFVAGLESLFFMHTSVKFDRKFTDLGLVSGSFVILTPIDLLFKQR